MDEILYVPYFPPGSQQGQWVDIYTRLNQERILFLNQPLTDGLANSLVSSMLYLDSDDQTKPIYLYINSLGDPVMAGMANVMAGMVSINSGLAIYDTMQHIKSEIVTICLGQAVGMAAVLLAAGSPGKRASLPHSTIVLTHPRNGARGQASDIQINAQEVLSKQNLIHQILSATTGQAVEKIAQDTERTLYMTPQEAKDYGLIDRILQSPKLVDEPAPAPAMA
jgi:ATP-dependent Clp protease, protease subunit